jgi:putative sterol carrier protein
MSGPTADARPTARAVVERLPDRFRPELAGKAKATVQLDLTGDGGGQWWVRIADGRCEVGTGTADRPDAVLTVAAADYVRIRLGELDAMSATMKGQLKVAGKVGVAVRFAKLFRTER